MRAFARRILWLWTLILAAAALVARPVAALAQAPELPADVSDARFDDDALPPAPAGYVSRDDGAVRWDLPEQSRAGEIVDELAAVVRREWPRIERELGAPEIDDRLHIRVARNPDEMRALAPPDAPPPAYAVGVAYPASGLVLLTLTAPETWDRPDLAHVIVHELSHVALHRAIGGRPVPRWLTEGLAIHQAHERSFERVQTLWEATVRGTLLPLDRLSAGFQEPSRVPVAYAESADFVEWLFRRGSPEDVFELVEHLRDGDGLERAVSLTWSVTLADLEREWRDGLVERYGAMPLLLGTGAIWLVISVLVVLAWIRRRRDARRTLRRWEAEEAEEARALARAQALAELRARAAEARAAAERAALGAEAAGDDEDDEDDDEPPAARDPHLPTIRWEGRDHTIH